MFKKWGSEVESSKTFNNAVTENLDKSGGKDVAEGTGKKSVTAGGVSGKANTILKGSKLTGDINIAYDLELSGDVEGNITSEKNSNITIQGTCKGNITTAEGRVFIEGEFHKGNIVAGTEVKITGKFNGGEVRTKGKIYINGEFNGKLEGNEIEIGPDARGKGELFYKEYISISKGAKIEAQITRTAKEPVLSDKSPANNVVDIKVPAT